MDDDDDDDDDGDGGGDDDDDGDGDDDDDGWWWMMMDPGWILDGGCWMMDVWMTDGRMDGDGGMMEWTMGGWIMFGWRWTDDGGCWMVAWWIPMVMAEEDHRGQHEGDFPLPQCGSWEPGRWWRFRKVGCRNPTNCAILRTIYNDGGSGEYVNAKYWQIWSVFNYFTSIHCGVNHQIRFCAIKPWVLTCRWAPIRFIYDLCHKSLVNKKMRRKDTKRFPFLGGASIHCIRLGGSSYLVNQSP